MKSNIELKVYVEVDMEKSYPYLIKCFANDKIFTACCDAYLAKQVCDMINYPSKKTKAEYVFLLTSCGYLSYEFNEPKNLKRISKANLIELYGKVLSAISNPKGCAI